MKILWIALVWPEPTSSAAGVRTTQLLKSLVEEGYAVTVVSPCKDNPFRKALEDLGIATHNLQANDSAFDVFIKELQPEIVFFDRFMCEEQFSWRVRKECPNALRILDSIDLHFVRRARESAAKSGGVALELESADLCSENAVREIASILRSDLTLLVSEAERSLLIERVGISAELLAVVPLYYRLMDRVPEFEERVKFVTIGNFNHAPNFDSYKVLREMLWPQIRERLIDRGVSNPELHIYGAYPKQEASFKGCPGLVLKGFVEECQATLSSYRVNIAPLRFGAGIKGKIADGWSVGTPTVTTSVGAEGMRGEDGVFGGVVADDWDEFIAQAVELYLDQSLWRAASIAGMQIIATNFSEASAKDLFVPQLRKLIHSVSGIRERNLMGQILWYSGNRSTEYFSRWIEEKNKVNPTSC